MLKNSENALPEFCAIYIQNDARTVKQMKVYLNEQRLTQGITVKV